MLGPVLRTGNGTDTLGLNLKLMPSASNYGENYKTYIVYDQGSSRGSIYEEFSIMTLFRHFINEIITPIGILISSFAITLGFLLFRHYAFLR